MRDAKTSTWRWIEEVGLRGAVICATAVILAWSGIPAAMACVGDCNGDETVTVDELMTGVNVALGSGGVNSCPFFDGNFDGAVTVDEVIVGITADLLGCSEPTITTIAGGRMRVSRTRAAIVPSVAINVF